jgi:hypothetical protein
MPIDKSTSTQRLLHRICVETVKGTNIEMLDMQHANRNPVKSCEAVRDTLRYFARADPRGSRGEVRRRAPYGERR